MKYILTLLCCLLMAPVFAETVGNVEYHLPQVAQEWEIGNKLQSEKGTTLIYIPKSTQRQNAKEFFGVNENNLTSNINDPALLKAGLIKTHPKMKIDLWVLENANDGILYEWSAKENGEEKVRGLGRAFSTKDGTVVLGYQTENISDVANVRSVWLPVLKDAKSK